MRSKIGNVKSMCFSMVTGSINKPPQLSVHPWFVDRYFDQATMNAAAVLSDVSITYSTTAQRNALQQS